MTLIIDYPTTNYTAGGFTPLSNLGYTVAGETFTAPLNARVTSAKFYVAKASGVTGNVTAKLYSTSGGVPNTVLATSNVIDASTFQQLGGGGPDDNLSLVEFTFSTSYLITSGTVYAICIEKNNSGSIYIGKDTSSPTFAGTFYFYGGGWSSSADDAIFYLYGTEYFANTSSFFNLM
jgi:hypothetical protein